MAVRSYGQKKQYVDEIKADGIATQVELDDAMDAHLNAYDHSALGSINLPATTQVNQIINSVDDGNGGFLWEVRDGTELLNGVSLLAEPYYYDEVRAKYLTNSTSVVTFYKDGTNIKNQYLYQTPGIVSSSLGYKIFGSYCIVGIEFYGTNSVSGDIIDIVDTVADQTVLTINMDSSDTSMYDNTTDITINDTELAAYVGNTGINTPVVKLYLKEIIIIV